MVQRVHTLSVVLLALWIVVVTNVACRQRPRLTTIVHGGDNAPTLVLLHGYGSSAEQWLPFTQTIRWPTNGRFVFPRAPERTMPPDGPADGRGWWRLDLASHIPPGRTMPDLSTDRPPGLKVAAASVEDTLRDRRSVPHGPLVLGGYSQGAMVASEVAFRSRVRLSGLVLLSGTLVDEASWEQHFRQRRDVPVFLAHGRSDHVLSFAIAERFRDKLQAAGVKVTWCPFDGGHEIPAAVIVALNDFIDGLHLRP